ncbi:hypothetical protein [Flavobacterium frigidimaris]|nr:hypothetical protein [Flavobacterium frigidimaris]
MFVIFGYTAYLYSIRRKILKHKEQNILVSNFSGSISAALNKKDEDKLKKRVSNAERIIDQSVEQMTYSIVLPLDIKLIETDNCILIKGSIESIETICYEFSNMDQLPEGFCVQLGDWKLFILEEKPQSCREDKIIVMPADHWLFMSRKLKESIHGEEIHPYNYIYEPFTFKKVLKYGIGAEATDYNNREFKSPKFN